MNRNMSKIVYNLLFMLTMSAEYEYIFSSMGIMMLLKQNRLNENIMKISKCLRL